MKTITLFISLLFFTVASWSQDLIAVQNGGTPTFYELLDDAISNAQPKDTIYLPGRAFTISTSINKELHFIGVGHFPDSTSATNRSIITSTIKLNEDANNGSIEGIYISAGSSTNNIGGVEFHGNVSNYTIKRNYITFGIRHQGDVITSNLYISENILGKVYLGGSDDSFNNFFKNNIFLAKGNTLNNASVKNCIFKANGTYPDTYFVNSVVENCIFNKDYPCSFSNSITHNNVNKGTNSGSSGNGNQGSGNFLDYVDLENVFSDYSATGDIYSMNFHLGSNSPYANAGRDGTDIGIYGGSSLWKEGSVPFNPHIQIKQISNTTDSNGNLQISIQVQAQER